MRGARPAPTSPLASNKRPRTSKGGAAPSQADEDAFMADLLAGIDASVFDAPPSSSQPGVSVSPPAAGATPSSGASRSRPQHHHSAPTRARPPTSASQQQKRSAGGAVPSSGSPRKRFSLSQSQRTEAGAVKANTDGGVRRAVCSPTRARPLSPRKTTASATRTKTTKTTKDESTNAPDDLLLGVLGLQVKGKNMVAAKGEAAMRVDPPKAPIIKTEPPSQPEPVGKIEKKPVRPAVPLTATPTLVNLKAEAQVDDSQDDYDGEWDLAALASMDEAALMQTSVAAAKYPILHPPVPQPPDGYKSAPWERCTVESVHNGLLDEIPQDIPTEDAAYTSFSVFLTAKTLVVYSTTGRRRLVHLKERWVDLKIRRGDVVNLISSALAQADTNAPIVVTMKDTAAYIVHHPDVLVTMTSIANAMPCARRPIVQQLVKLPEPPSKSMLYGTILHSLLQGSLSEQSFDRASTARRVADELARDESRLAVWGAGLDAVTVADELGPKAEDAFACFGHKWIGPSPAQNGEVKTARDEVVGTLAITGLHDIEEDIWSPKWGLKGKVDASVQATVRRDGTEGDMEFVSPLEIKTGKSIGGVQHRAQTMLYTLLMEDRYGLPVPAGLLYYSQRNTIVLVEARANEVRALIMARNELAEWMVRERSSRKPAPAPPLVPPTIDSDDEFATPPEPQVAPLEDVFLPETIDRPSDCTRCFSADVCMLYRKAVDRVPQPEDDPIAELYQSKTGHLSDAHAAFFAHWERLLSLEEQDTVRMRAQLWTMTAKAREKAGRAFADMVIAAEAKVDASLNRIHKWSYTFERASVDGVTQPASLLSGHITKNDPVAVGMDGLPSLARGFVTELAATSVTVAVANQLDVTELLKRTRSPLDPSRVTFRIDRDELASGMQRMRGNLAQLFLADGDAKRRRLVVDLAPPEFDRSRAPEPHEIPASLNPDQRAAMYKVLTAKDFALVLGMPGTGKTTTIAEIIKAIVERGQSVLLTSYTHSAVDTIVSKLLGADFQVLRLGNQDKVHPDVRHLTLDALGPSATPEQMAARLMEPPVVAATCLAVDHPLFHRRRFDYCIVDEASQITLPTCLGPLRCAETFVLVGDHFQLPPIVRKAEARAGGLDVSLFRRLSDAHPSAVAPLAAQYRMNEDIMLLSNRLIYEDRLRCGSEAVAKQALTLRDRKQCRDIWPGATCGEGCWVQGLLDEDAKAVFVDTDRVPGHETRAGDLVQNPTEAALVYTLVRALVASGVREHDIAVITPYRQQIKLLSSLFHSTLPRVELLTADRAQGRDKDVVLFSMVRSNDRGAVGDLLRDWRRLNVAFTRAKKKLVVFGSRRTLGTDRLLGDFFGLVEERGWVRGLERGADGEHPEEAVGKVEEEVGGGKEEGKSKGGTAGKRAVLGERLLNAHPFVKEVLAEANGE